jgi:endonuclease YncB( thermonuclease family)
MTTWTVPARVTRVIDGDTFVCDLDLGWGLWRIGARVRLAGIDCPELRAVGGEEARVFAAGLVQYETVTVVSESLDKYGRTLARVLLPSGRDLADLLIEAGHGQPA